MRRATWFARRRSQCPPAVGVLSLRRCSCLNRRGLDRCPVLLLQRFDHAVMPAVFDRGRHRAGAVLGMSQSRVMPVSIGPGRATWTVTPRPAPAQHAPGHHRRRLGRHGAGAADRRRHARRGSTGPASIGADRSGSRQCHAGDDQLRCLAVGAADAHQGGLGEGGCLMVRVESCLRSRQSQPPRTSGLPRCPIPCLCPIRRWSGSGHLR